MRNLLFAVMAMLVLVSLAVAGSDWNPSRFSTKFRTKGNVEYTVEKDTMARFNTTAAAKIFLNNTTSSTGATGFPIPANTNIDMKAHPSASKVIFVFDTLSTPRASVFRAQ